MSGHILIVDDDPDSRLMLEAAISGDGFTPILADSGEEALAILETRVPDIILLDAVMPGLDGFETCRRVKAIPDVAHVPIIFMTGLSASEHVVAGLEAGGVDYVTKPIRLEELSARIRVHLGNARKAQGALAALSSAQGRMISSDREGNITWSNPEAERLLRESEALGSRAFATTLRSLICDGSDEEAASSLSRNELLLTVSFRQLRIAYIGPGAEGEHLFTLAETIEGMEALYLHRRLSLTPREADVLLWVARGKGNRDISEILNISPRTVNKHLEQIFTKLGVENRAAAASIAVETLHSV